jgi:hypothetical protein
MTKKKYKIGFALGGCSPDIAKNWGDMVLSDSQILHQSYVP